MKNYFVNNNGISTLSFGRFFAAIIVIFIVQMTAHAAPTTWFVSKSGSDSNSCSQSQSSATAKRTIKAGLACIGSVGSSDAGADDILQVAAGSYSEDLIDVIPSGSGVGHEFTLKCATHLACTSTTSSDAYNIGFGASSHHIIIRDFIITGGLGAYMSGTNATHHHHISWLNNEFSALPQMSLQASGASNITVTGNVFHDIGDNCGAGPGYCHGVYASDFTNDWTISQNEFYDIGGYGVHVYAGSIEGLSNRFVIDRNDIHDNGERGVTGAGIIVYGYDHVIMNNLSYRNAYEGILLRGVGGVMVYNNTTWSNGGSGISMEYGVNTTCRNNLTIDDGGTEISGCTTTGNNVTTGSAASHFASTSSSNFALVSGSTAVGTGATLSQVATDFTGAARRSPSDVGALQLVTSAPPPADTISPVPGGGGVLTGTITQ